MRDEAEPGVRLTPRRSGRVSADFARRLEQYGGSGRLLRRVRDVVDDDPRSDTVSDSSATTGAQRLTRDPLTGLFNRRTALAETQRLLTDSSDELWVLALDLNDFTWVNDTWGHDTGDELIIAVAHRLTALAPTGARVARIGGDEFLMVLAASQETVVAVAERITESFRQPVPLRDRAVVVSARIGIARGDRPGATAQTLMRDADTAMYQARTYQSGGYALFDSAMRERASERAELQTDLHDALDRGDQLFLAYQPVVEIGTGRVLGAEVLLRWRHPKRGMLPPIEFIPLAETSGLIGEIDDWVRGEALRQLAEWRGAGIVPETFHLSLNVSAQRLRNRNLPAAIEADLLRYDVPAGVVALEMTEMVILDDSPAAGELLAGLRSLGLRLVVDDFGTGYSSLEFLRRLPVTGIKLDRSLVSELGDNPIEEQIVRAVVAISDSLGLSIVAEGVETSEQRDLLIAVGVTQGQGYLWSPPVSAAQLAALRQSAPTSSPPSPGMPVTAPDRLIEELEELLRAAAERPGRA